MKKGIFMLLAGIVVLAFLTVSPRLGMSAGRVCNQLTIAERAACLKEQGTEKGESDSKPQVVTLAVTDDEVKKDKKRKRIKCPYTGGYEYPKNCKEGCPSGYVFDEKTKRCLMWCAGEEDYLTCELGTYLTPDQSSFCNCKCPKGTMLGQPKKDGLRYCEDTILVTFYCGDTNSFVPFGTPCNNAGIVASFKNLKAINDNISILYDRIDSIYPTYIYYIIGGFLLVIIILLSIYIIVNGKEQNNTLYDISARLQNIEKPLTQLPDKIQILVNKDDANESSTKELAMDDLMELRKDSEKPPDETSGGNPSLFQKK